MRLSTIFRKGRAQDLMECSRGLRSAIKLSMRIHDSAVVIVDQGTSWAIQSSTDRERSYYILKIHSSCSGDADRLDALPTDCPESADEERCLCFRLTNCCRHMFSCSWDDYLNGDNCKHILKVSSFLGSWDLARTTLYQADLRHAFGPSAQPDFEEGQMGLGNCCSNDAIPDDSEGLANPTDDNRQPPSASMEKIRMTLNVSSACALDT